MAGLIHIVAVTARTGLGLTAEASAAAVRAGISRQADHPFMVDHTGEKVRSVIDGRLESTVLGWQRLVGLAAPTMVEMVSKIVGGVAPSGPIRILLALPEIRPGFQNADANRVLAALRNAAGSRGACEIELVGRGHAGGLEALEVAAEWLAGHRQDVCIVGGVDSYFEADTIDWLEAHRQLAASDVRSGFIPGEAAGFVALAGEGARKQLHLPSLAILRGAGTARETKLIKTDDINVGEGLAQAIRNAIRDLRLPDEAVDAVYCDINGERYRSEEWGFALLRGGQVAVKSSAYVAPADCWGDLGAASGPLLCILAVRSWARRYAPGSRALVFGGSETGARGAVVLEAPAGA